MHFIQNGSPSIGETTINHNLTAFKYNGGYGAGQRMGLLIYPVVAYNTFYLVNKSEQRVLLVGCRSEDDVFWMRAYGYRKAIGFDLFSYSKNVLVGDIHKTEFADESFNVVLLGWMISYTKDPAAVIKECRRILKPGGLLGIGIEHNPNQDNANILPPRVNHLNSTSDIISLLNATIKHKVLFEYDHQNDKDSDYSTAVVSICQ
jgi:SAM-dependent methyltransferase